MVNYTVPHGYNARAEAVLEQDILQAVAFLQNEQSLRVNNRLTNKVAVCAIMDHDPTLVYEGSPAFWRAIFRRNWGVSLKVNWFIRRHKKMRDTVDRRHQRN